MPSAEALHDTTTPSAIMTRGSRVVGRARAYLNEHRMFKFSIIGASKVLSLTDEVIVRADDVYSSLKKAGNLIGDADILIGATALVHGLAVATDNEDHFQRITGLRVENWLRD